MAPQSGFTCKLQVNGQAFSGQRWSLSDNAGPVDVSNTEGTPGNPAGGSQVGHESNIPSVTGRRLSITRPSFDPNENDYLAPRSLTVGAFVPVRIFPSGLAGRSWYCSGALVVGVEYSGDVKQAQPLSWTFVGDGTWNDPII